MIDEIISPTSPLGQHASGFEPLVSLPSAEDLRRSNNSILDSRFIHQGFGSLVTLSGLRPPVSLADNLTIQGFIIKPLKRVSLPSTNALNPVSTAVVREITALAAGKEDEARPTARAYASARNIVESAYGKARSEKNLLGVMPTPYVTTDDLGGIRLLWHTGTRKLRANFGAEDNLRSYLYFETELEHNIEPLDADHLAERLVWLTSK